MSNDNDDEQKLVAISRYEARLLVEHWLEHAEFFLRWWYVHEREWCYDVSENWYALRRVNELVESGLNSNAETDSINEKVRKLQDGWETTRGEQVALWKAQTGKSEREFDEWIDHLRYGSGTQTVLQTCLKYLNSASSDSSLNVPPADKRNAPRRRIP